MSFDLIFARSDIILASMWNFALQQFWSAPSNTRALWPAARRAQRGYNPSVEPSLGHVALIQKCGFVWGQCGKQQPQLVCLSTSETVYDPKLGAGLSDRRGGVKGDERNMLRKLSV